MVDLAAAVDLAVAVASAAPVEPSVLLVSAAESILKLKILFDSQQPVWSVLCHGADSTVAASLAACFVGFEPSLPLVVALR